MAVYKIVQYGDRVLREKAKPVKKYTPNLFILLDNMRETMFEAKGVGLAAPQIGVSKRVIVALLGDDVLELINPEIMEASGEEIDSEACLSLPGLIGEVARAEKVKVRGFNRDGEELECTASGYAARILQHEIDHLDGILFVDRAKNVRRENT